MQFYVTIMYTILHIHTFYILSFSHTQRLADSNLLQNLETLTRILPGFFFCDDVHIFVSFPILARDFLMWYYLTHDPTSHNMRIPK